MQPVFNSFPQLPNQIQPNAAAQPGSQVFAANQSLAKSCNMVPNSVPVQPQMGMMNLHMGNSNMPPLITTQPGFMNAPNLLGAPHLGSVNLMSQPSQSNVGFGPQYGLGNFNNVPMFLGNGQFCNFPQNVNLVNPSQPQVQGPLVHNLSNLQQQFNRNMGLVNGQFCFQNPMQNINPLLGMQLSNPSQVGPFGVSPTSHQVLAGLNPSLLTNPQFGLSQSNHSGQQLNQTHQGLVPPILSMNASTPSPIQGSSLTSLNSSSSQSQQTQNLQPSGPRSIEGNVVKHDQINISNTKRKNFQRRNLDRYPRKEAAQHRSQMSQFHLVDNTKRKFGFYHEHKRKGHGNDKRLKFDRPNFTSQDREKKRSLAPTYTEQEVQQWRQERRKNYPSKTNIEKKLAEKVTGSTDIDRETKLRREQLKEILAKQAELGVEVAEIPSHYLSDSEKQMHHKDENARASCKNGRFQNKRNRRGRHNKKDQFVRNKPNKDSSDMSRFNKKKPTLLQKLFGADIRRDKSRLLQVFRFMVMNSFFKDWPEEPLKFPLVTVKESGCESEVVKETCPPVAEDIAKTSDKMDTDYGADEHVNVSKDDGSNANDGGDDDDSDGGGGGGGEKVKVHEEEEGEIIG